MDDWTFLDSLRGRRCLVRNNRQLINGATTKAAYRVTTPPVRGPSRLLFDSTFQLINGATTKAAYRVTTPPVRGPSRLLFDSTRTRLDSSGGLVRVTSSTLGAFSGALISSTLVGKNIARLESFAALSLQQPRLASVSNERPLSETRADCSRCRGRAQDINSLHFAKGLLKQTRTVFRPRKNRMNKYGGEKTDDARLNIVQQKESA